MFDPSALTTATPEQWDQLAELLQAVTMPKDKGVDTIAHEACERERDNANPLRIRELCHGYIDYLIWMRGELKRDRPGREALRNGVVGTEYLGLWFLANSVALRRKLDLPERPPQQLRWCECDPPDATFRGLLDWCNLADRTEHATALAVPTTPARVVVKGKGKPGRKRLAKANPAKLNAYKMIHTAVESFVDPGPSHKGRCARRLKHLAEAPEHRQLRDAVAEAGLELSSELINTACKSMSRMNGC